MVVGPESELYSKKLFANNINWQVDIDKIEKLNGKEEKEEIDNKYYFKCFAKIRYRAKEAESAVKIKKSELQEKETLEVEFKEPQRAITKGQSVVFYDEDGIVLGGGKIL